MVKLHNICTLHGNLEHETPAAYFFRQEDKDKAAWIPKSQCEWNPEDEEMQMPEWLAIEKGLI